MTSEADAENVCRILLADDHDTYRKTISSLFERRGYNVTSASCGDEVLAAAVEQPFDVFVLDYKMPGNEELILVEQLHALQPDVPVILLTGFASLPSAMSAVRLQLFDYIQKGESPDHLLSRVDEAVRHTQLEKKLRASEARYRLLAENIQDVITVFSAAGKAVYASPSITTVLGYAPEEFFGTDIYALVHPEDRAGLEGAKNCLFESGLVNDFESRFLTRNGRYIWLSTSAKLLRNDFGEPQELICSSRDITSRKQTEHALQEAEERYRAVVNDLTEIVCRFRADGTITFVNEVYCRFFGKTRDELLGGKWHPLVVPEDVPIIEDRLKLLSSSNSVVDVENRVISGSGKVHWMQFINHAFFDAAGRLIETQSVGRDITDRKQAEERIRQLAQHLETVREEERKRLSRELHDDIGQIFTALKIDLSILMDHCTCEPGIGQKMADMQQLLGSGIHSVHSLCRRLRPGALDDLGLEEALAGLVDDWKQRNKVACDLHVDLDEEMLSDDIKTAVFRIVQEALTNVSRHARSSRVEIHLVSDGSILNFSIGDNGCGMDLDAELKPASFGLLGMRERIEALKGDLHVESTAGRGTRIDATIPLLGAE